MCVPIEATIGPEGDVTLPKRSSPKKPVGLTWHEGTTEDASLQFCFWGLILSCLKTGSTFWLEQVMGKFYQKHLRCLKGVKLQDTLLVVRPNQIDLELPNCGSLAWNEFMTEPFDMFPGSPLFPAALDRALGICLPC